MELFYLLRKFSIIIPTLLTIVIPGLYNLYVEDGGGYCKGEELLQNHMHISVPTNPLIDILLYLRNTHSASLSDIDKVRARLYSTTGGFPSIWNFISQEEEEEEEKQIEDSQSALTKTVCRDQGPFARYFPAKQTWSCQIVKGAEELSKLYFWEMLLPAFSFFTATVMYMLTRHDSFKNKWDQMLESTRQALSFNPNYAMVPVKSANMKIQELTEGTDTEDEGGDSDGGGDRPPCHCDMCTAHLAAQILLKQKVEELDTNFF